MTPREKALFAMLIGEKYGELLSCEECGERYVLAHEVDREEYRRFVTSKQDVKTFKYCRMHATQRGGGAAYRRSLKELLEET